MEAKAALVPVVRGFPSFLCTLSSCGCLVFSGAPCSRISSFQGASYGLSSAPLT